METTHRTLYLKGFDMMVSLIIATLVSAYSLYMLISKLDGIAFLIYFIPSFALPIFLTFVFTNKVIFGNGYIGISTIFKKRQIALADVARWGVWHTGKFTATEVTAAAADLGMLKEPVKYNIYLLASSEFNLSALKEKTTLSFPYRKEFYQTVAAMMSERASAPKPHA